MMNPGFELFHYWRSSSSWRVRWALFHKGIDFKSTQVNLLDGESESPEHAARNPAGFVPVLKTHDGHYLTESLAIIRYLEELYPTPSLFPGTALDHAQIWALAEVINSGTQPLQNIPVMDRHTSDPEEKKKWSQGWILQGLDIYEKLAKMSCGKFSHGNELSVADICLIPQCYNATRFEVDFRQFPTISRVYDECHRIESLQKSHPDQYKP